MSRTGCSPAEKVEGCIHHWLIDSEDVGQCLKCGAVRDFRRIAGKSLSKVMEKEYAALATTK
jgi:hypothetical protein